MQCIALVFYINYTYVQVDQDRHVLLCFQAHLVLPAKEKKKAAEVITVLSLIIT